MGLDWEWVKNIWIFLLESQLHVHPGGELQF